MPALYPPFSCLFLSLSVSLIDYCFVALTNATAGQDLSLQKSPNACRTFVLSIEIKRDEHVISYYSMLGWLKVDVRRSYFVGCLLHRIMIEKSQSLYKVLNFKIRSNVKTSTLNVTLALPLCRTLCEAFKRSFVSSAAELWNGLPPGIRNVRTAERFKHDFYAFLLAHGKMGGRVNV